MPNSTPWAALAKTLGVSAQSVAAWRRLADAPETPDVEAWRAFRASRLLGKDTATKTLADLKAELMREQIELARTKNRRESGEVIDREVVEEMLGILAQKLDLLLRLKLEVELGPRVVGKSAAEANVEGTLMLDEIREVIGGNLAKFKTDALRQQRDAE
jgi:hypothetical protein